MSKDSVKTQIDIDITNKTTSKSISPLNVDDNMKAVVDLIPDITSKENISNKSINIITDNTSDIKYPTTKAVATYVDGLAAESWVNKSINIITDATSDTKYPSVKAVKTYVDSNIGGNQDLQSVLDIGNEVIGQNNDGTKIIFIDTNAYDDEGTLIEEISEAIYGADIKIKYTNNEDGSQEETSIKRGDISLEYSEDTDITRSTYISSGNIEVKYGEAGLYLSTVSSGSGESFRELGALWFYSALNGNPNSLTILSENPASTGGGGSYLDLKLPSHTGSQTRTLATLDDIQASLPTYADNATAIAGGLVINNHYKTVTGELRVVI